ncbi:MAG TPA: hypothetical protein VGV85_06460 [Longimicrobiaceae bacterium]|nr:hypothetical protein [Longimicrobiaceae bacterium]
MTDTAAAATPPLPGQIVFDPFFAPAMESGDYRVGLSHAAKSTDPGNPFAETFAAELTFAVLGPRFALPPGYVSTVFPPPDAQGEYGSVLAHVVSPVKTLPWQRAAREPGTRYPWLALLTFDGADPPPVPVSGTLADLVSPPAGTVSYPDLRLEHGEALTDPVLYIDVDAALFTAIAPTLDELAWLVHGRTLDAGSLLRRADAGGEGPSGEYSSVFSNRLPKPGSRTVCFLVSVEDMGALLPPATPSAAAVRLAVLHSWSFGSVPLGETFREYFEKIDRDPATLQVPYASAGAPSAAVRQALEMGYTAVNHHTRQGAATVSWYRGPLLPFASPPYVRVPIPSPDSLVRYDPRTGMFDVSLAAAWQVGQLLALADLEFSTALYNWKRGEQRQAVVDWERRFLAGLLELDPAAISAPGVPAHVQMMRQVIRPLLSAFLKREG